MTSYTFILVLLFLVRCGSVKPSENNVSDGQKEPASYNIVLKTYRPDPTEDDSTEIPGKIDTLTIRKLNEPLKALAAFYSAMGGTLCSHETCTLTTALGLGKQGSEKHKELIRKYFPNDKVAEAVIKQDCYLRPTGASSFSDYEYLTINNLKDTVKVDYNLMIYGRGDVIWIAGPDVYLFKNNTFLKLKRNLWTYINE